MTQRLNRERNGSLAQAMTLLIQNQAAFLGQLAESNRRYTESMASIDQRFVLVDKRFAAIESELRQIRFILNELPEAIRQKIGFKAPKST